MWQVYRNSEGYNVGFTDKRCKAYPCHKGVNESSFNCKNCYCPLYRFEKCLGTPTWIESNGQRIKDCSDCSYPHQIENQSEIEKFLSENGGYV